MLLKDVSEYGLIEMIRKACSDGPGIVVGIGDDAAVLETDPQSRLVVTSDMLVEGVHFDLSFISAYQLGWKSLAVNLSDIAAMGGIPRFTLISLGLPDNTEVSFVEEFFRGFREIGEKFKTYLCGGDTVKSPSGMIISVTVLGSLEAGRVLTRSGARPGDLLAVTGVLGNSAAGLALLQKGILGRFSPEVEEELLKAHLEPVPRVQEGRFLITKGVASAVNDISDGLALEVKEIAEASGVGAVIYGHKIPVSEAAEAVAKFLKWDPLQWALGGGEDYELVFAFSPKNQRKLKELIQKGIPIVVIGEITAQKGEVYVEFSDKKRISLDTFGYDHFK